jgi:hypothetical protein
MDKSLIGHDGPTCRSVRRHDNPDVIEVTITAISIGDNGYKGI